MKTNKKSTKYGYLTKDEINVILSALIAYVEISDDEADEAQQIIKKISKNLSDDDIEFSNQMARQALEDHALERFEEGREYEYDHDHRWDWKKRYIEVPPEMEQLLIESWQKRRTIWMEYASNSANDGERRIKQREVDIYSIDGGYFSGYCHLRKEERTFRMDRIVSVRPTKKSYTIPW